MPRRRLLAAVLLLALFLAGGCGSLGGLTHMRGGLGATPDDPRAPTTRFRGLTVPVAKF